MQTLLSSKSKQVIIDTEGPVVIIGEKINPTGRKKLAAALQEGNLNIVRELAESQLAAGADVLDVNVGVPDIDQASLLPKVVKMLSVEFDIPLCLDSPDAKALESALSLAPGKPLVNSVNGEEASLKAVLPLVKERGAAVIGLTMDDNGIPTDAETRLAIAGRILERAAQAGIPAEDVIIDPLVMTVGYESNAAKITLAAIEMIRREFGVNINIGASNVSFGLPDRDTVNQAFLGLAILAGASCAITDPIKFVPTVRAADLLLGRDGYARRYNATFRARAKLNL